MFKAFPPSGAFAKPGTRSTHRTALLVSLMHSTKPSASSPRPDPDSFLLSELMPPLCQHAGSGLFSRRDEAVKAFQAGVARRAAPSGLSGDKEGDTFWGTAPGPCHSNRQRWRDAADCDSHQKLQRQGNAELPARGRAPSGQTLGVTPGNSTLEGSPQALHTWRDPRQGCLSKSSARVDLGSLKPV